MENKQMSVTNLGRDFVYIFKKAFQIKPYFFIGYILITVLVSSVDSVLIILLYNYLLDSISFGYSFSEIVITLIGVGGVLGTLLICLKCFLQKKYEIVSIEINQNIQKELFNKIVTLDYEKYDDSTFYDSFIRAFDKGEVLIKSCIKIVIDFISNIASVVSIAGVVLFILPMSAVFPCIACAVFLITQFFRNKVMYQLNLELDPIKRRKQYCTRVFYQPEYAKETRLTDIIIPILESYNAAVTEESELIEKYKFRILLGSILNTVIGWTVWVYFVPINYLVYNAIVTKRIDIGGVAAVYESNTSLVNTINSLTENVSSLHEIGMFSHLYRTFMEIKSNIEGRDGISVSKNSPQLLEIKDLSYKYRAEEADVLKHISMTIQPGEKVAIVGYNGSGKSTLIKLLLHLYKPTSGGIFYNNININQYSTESYRSLFGTVLQDFQIYGTSIANNVCMDICNDKNRDKVSDSLKVTDMLSKIHKLKDKENTILSREFSKDGIVLSGGENQKLAFSRLYVNYHPLIILDEPSSALDPISEQQMNQKIFTDFKNETVIFVAHRLSATKFADKIYLFKDGEIVEEGTHDELMKKDNFYASMFSKQASYYRLSDER